MPGKTAAQFLRSFERSGFMVDLAWTPAGGGAGKTFKALFQDAASKPVMGFMTATEPTITFEAEYCPNLTNGDTVATGGVTYKVRDGGNFKDATAKRYQIRKAPA